MEPKADSRNGSCRCLNIRMQLPKNFMRPDREPAKVDPVCASSCLENPITCAQETKPKRTCKNGSRRHLREFPVHVPTKLTRGSLPKWILLVPTRIHLTCAQWAAREKACQSGSLHVPPKPHPRSISKMCPAKPYLKELAKKDPMGASTIPGCL
jgi:hypothetical protein